MYREKRFNAAKQRAVKATGLVLLLALPISAEAQQKQVNILANSNPQAIAKIQELRAKQAQPKKSYLEMFLKCDGKNGNANFDFDYGTPEHYEIDASGKCVYLMSNYGGH